MAIEVWEQWGRRQVSRGVNPRARLIFGVSGTDDYNEALDAVIAEAPASLDPYGGSLVFIPLATPSIAEVGDELWEAELEYAVQPVTEDTVVSFSTGGGTVHQIAAREVIGRYAPTGDPVPSNSLLIGATEDGVEGIDTVATNFKFTETHYIDDAEVTNTYKGILANLTGRYNDASFKGFAAGECMLTNVSGNRRGLGDWELAFEFECQPNATDLEIDCGNGKTITGIAKKGWEAFDYEYKNAVETISGSKRLTRFITGVRILAVGKGPGDFSSLGIGT